MLNQVSIDFPGGLKSNPSEVKVGVGSHTPLSGRVAHLGPKPTKVWVVFGTFWSVQVLSQRRVPKGVALISSAVTYGLRMSPQYEASLKAKVTKPLNVRSN